MSRVLQIGGRRPPTSRCAAARPYNVVVRGTGALPRREPGSNLDGDLREKTELGPSGGFRARARAERAQEKAGPRADHDARPPPWFAIWASSLVRQSGGLGEDPTGDPVLGPSARPRGGFARGKGGPRSTRHRLRARAFKKMRREKRPRSCGPEGSRSNGAPTSPPRRGAQGRASSCCHTHRGPQPGPGLSDLAGASCRSFGNPSNQVSSHIVNRRARATTRPGWSPTRRRPSPRAGRSTRSSALRHRARSGFASQTEVSLDRPQLENTGRAWIAHWSKKTTGIPDPTFDQLRGLPAQGTSDPRAAGHHGTADTQTTRWNRGGSRWARQMS